MKVDWEENKQLVKSVQVLWIYKNASSFQKDSFFYFLTEVDSTGYHSKLLYHHTNFYKS